MLHYGPVVVCGHAEAAEEADPALVDDLAVPVDGVLRRDAQPARLAVEQRLLVVLSLHVMSLFRSALFMKVHFIPNHVVP